MSTDDSWLSAAPLAFLLILPVFFYYCLRALLAQQQQSRGFYAPDTRIPEYLIKQYVDKTRQVRKQYRTLAKKINSPQPKQRSPKISRKPVQTVFLQTLGKCSVGLAQFAKANSKYDLLNPNKCGNSRIWSNLQCISKRHYFFEPTLLTPIYEDLEY